MFIVCYYCWSLIFSTGNVGLCLYAVLFVCECFFSLAFEQKSLQIAPRHSCRATIFVCSVLSHSPDNLHTHLNMNKIANNHVSKARIWNVPSGFFYVRLTQSYRESLWTKIFALLDSQRQMITSCILRNLFQIRHSFNIGGGFEGDVENKKTLSGQPICKYWFLNENVS